MSAPNNLTPQDARDVAAGLIASARYASLQERAAQAILKEGRAELVDEHGSGRAGRFQKLFFKRLAGMFFPAKRTDR